MIPILLVATWCVTTSVIVRRTELRLLGPVARSQSPGRVGRHCTSRTAESRDLNSRLPPLARLLDPLTTTSARGRKGDKAVTNPAARRVAGSVVR
jgi:hypothetical protein